MCSWVKQKVRPETQEIEMNESLKTLAYDSAKEFFDAWWDAWLIAAVNEFDHQGRYDFLAAYCAWDGL